MVRTKRSQVFPKHLQNSPIVTNSQRKHPISLASARRLVSFLVTEKGKGEMALHFVGMRKISHLHALHFNDPSSTDCITLSYNDPNFLGEVFVCPQAAKEYVAQSGGDFAKELTLYVVHGFLHLLGFDDQTPGDRKKMRREEEKWMRILAKNNLGITIR